MSLLTREEIFAAFGSSDGTWESAGRAVIAAYEAKLREQKPGTRSETALKLKRLASNWCNEHAQPVVCGSLNQKELYALIDQVCIGIDSPPSAPEVSNQLSGNSGQVTEGYQLVPIEPTEAMLEAAWALNLDIEGIRQHCTNRYKEMLAAARSE